MKHTILLVTGFVLLHTGIRAQTRAEIIERALAAAPERARETATVIKWNADYTYETLKQGTSHMVCYDRSDEPRRPAFAVQCTSVANLERVAQNRRFRMESADADAERAMVSSAEENGSRAMPEYGSIWIMMQGPDQASARIHLTIAVPGATTESVGLPDDHNSGGAYIMDPGTSAAHVMIPGR